jgi:MHS family proline/betaine transporter-like MFS transporter
VIRETERMWRILMTDSIAADGFVHEHREPVINRRRKVACAIVGTWLEYYDFTAYTFFSVSIGRQFFPVSSPSGQLLLALGTFGVGFIMRPVGAAVLGVYADRAGRKAALSLAILLMFLGTAILAFTPSYAQIGVLAPSLIILARLIQGFSAGGEIGAATTYLIASVPENRRMTYGSWQTAVQGLAGLTASLLGYCLSSLLPADQMDTYGWRIALAFGLLIGPIGLYLRLNIKDDAIRSAQPVKGILKEVFFKNYSIFLIGLMPILDGTVGSYIITKYMTTYAINTLHLPNDIAFLISVVSSAATVIGAIAGGYLADRFGKRLLMIVPQGLFVLATWPAFIVITQDGDHNSILVMIAGLALLRAISGGVALVAIAECFPERIRTTGLCLVFAVGVALFGGTAQLIATWILDITGSAMSLAWYLIATNTITFFALFNLRPSIHRS